MKKVGIIGGLGPETTSEFYLDLVFSCQKKDRTHRPSIIIASVPLPYKIEEEAIAKNIGFERIPPFLIEEAKRLEKAVTNSKAADMAVTVSSLLVTAKALQMPST